MPPRRRAVLAALSRAVQPAPVAQLDRAPDYESGGQEFESLRARHFFNNTAMHIGAVAEMLPNALQTALLCPTRPEHQGRLRGCSRPRDGVR
jgi:hypothetical protein